MLESLTKLTDVTDVNVNKDERWASLAGGAILLLYAMIRIPLSAVLATVAATYLIFRGIRGFCYFYDRLGMNRAVALPPTAVENKHKQRMVVTPQ
jgi:uncharacterized membrane protein